MRTRNRIRTVIAIAAALLMVATAALAADLHTDATLETSAGTPTEVSIGENSFTIELWATGNLMSAQSATVVNRYFMAANGAITASSELSDRSSAPFASGNYSSPTGPCSGPSPALGCSSNPHLINATLVVAPGAPDSTTGSFQISHTGATNLNADTSLDTYRVKVNAPPSATLPTVSHLLSPTAPNGDNGWYTGAVGITWTITGTPAPSESPGCAVASVSDDGVHSLTCSATNDAGTASDTASFKIDQSEPNPPTIGLHPAPNSAGWNNSAVDVSFTAAGDNGPSGVAGCTDGFIISTETAGQLVSGTCTDNAGNESAAATATVKLDETAPAVSDLGPTTAPNAAGWYKVDVTNEFEASDGLSGLPASFTNPFTQTTTGEGAAVTVSSGPVADVAGNTNAGMVSQSFQIDKTDPVVNVTGVADGATYTLGSVPAAGCATTDALSGVAAHATLSISGGPVGSITVDCQGAEDAAGNTNSASATYNVNYAFTGFFRPIDNAPTLNRVKAGSAVPVKFSLSGNQGLGIVAAGFPKSAIIACDTWAPVDTVEETLTAGASSLSYDALTDQYTYVWKTEKAWSGCRQLQVKLIDGQTHKANFQFTK